MNKEAKAYVATAREKFNTGALTGAVENLLLAAEAQAVEKAAPAPKAPKAAPAKK